MLGLFTLARTGRDHRISGPAKWPQRVAAARFSGYS